jgi:hypothetical protein
LRAVRAPGQADVDAYRHGAAGDERGQRRVEPALVEDGRVDPADQAAQVLDGCLGFLVRLLEERARVVRVALEP